MIARFGKPVPVLCMINNYMIDYTYQAHSHRILQWNDSILQGKLKENILGRCLSNCEKGMEFLTCDGCEDEYNK